MTVTEESTVQTIEIRKEIDVHAAIDLTFESILAELGPEGQMPGGQPFPMTFEARPGGRWFRDLGDDAGHLWGHVQVIKPPKLIEITGPMFMSYPAANHIQYRLTATTPTKTRLTFTHRGFGLIPKEHREGVSEGWQFGLDLIRELAERRTKK
jgi:uncharacterized protein YndB with AHSA1/START domain